MNTMTEQIHDPEPYIVREAGFGFTVRRCSCGHLSANDEQHAEHVREAT